MRPTILPVVSRALALLLVVLPAAGCATKGDLRNVTNELRLVRASQDSLLSALQRQARITQDSLRGTSGQLLDIRGSFNQQLTRLQEELAMSRQENAQLQRALSSILDQLERVAASQPSAAGGFSVGTQVPGASSTAAELYGAAQEAFARGSLQTARSAFNDVLAQYPNDPLAPDAQYYLADILAQEQKKEEAIAAFNLIPERYPGAPKVPEAIYRTGVLYQELGKRSEARAAYERIIASYPSSTIAGTAADRLREMGPGR
jgi:tol-pal system protein YbgF